MKPMTRIDPYIIELKIKISLLKNNHNHMCNGNLNDFIRITKMNPLEDHNMYGTQIHIKIKKELIHMTGDRYSNEYFYIH